MQNAVNQMYRLLSLKENDRQEYETEIEFGSRYTAAWDDPAPPAKQKGAERTVLEDHANKRDTVFVVSGFLVEPQDLSRPRI